MWEREEGREGEKERKTLMWERNIDWLAPTGGLIEHWTHNPGMRLAWELDQLPFVYGMMLQPTEPHWPQLSSYKATKPMRLGPHPYEPI